jgi:hypothetical protein
VSAGWCMRAWRGGVGGLCGSSVLVSVCDCLHNTLCGLYLHLITHYCYYCYPILRRACARGIELLVSAGWVVGGGRCCLVGFGGYVRVGGLAGIL